jgi:shikimate kinase
MAEARLRSSPLFCPGHSLPERHLVLVGMMGSGKTTLAEVLGRSYGLPWYDVDQCVEAEEGRTIAQIFAESGERYFRKREGEVLQRLLSLPAGVIATGGGTFVLGSNRQRLLQKGVVVYLEAPAQVLWERVKESNRPLLQGKEGGLEHFERVLQSRAPFYEQAPYRVRVDGRSIESVAEELWRVYLGAEGRL